MRHQFFNWFLDLFVKKSMFKSHKNMIVNAASLCPAVRISSDAMKKDGIGGKSIKHIASQPFLALNW